MEPNISDEEIFQGHKNDTDVFNLIYKYRIIGASWWIFIVILGLLGSFLIKFPFKRILKIFIYKNHIRRKWFCNKFSYEA